MIRADTDGVNLCFRRLLFIACVQVLQTDTAVLSGSAGWQKKVFRNPACKVLYMSMKGLDKFRDECALFGVWNRAEAANLTYLGLYAQQHRGQEGAGVTALERNSSASFTVHRGLGLVSEVFGDFDFSALPGNCAIGHVRYTTAGGHKLINVQPLFAEISSGNVALAHNGNLVNADELKRDLIREGAIFSTTSDTEVILHLLARAPRNVVRVEALISALERVRGAYALLVLFEDRLFAVRDPYGFRPLVLGTLDGGVALASETCAFDLLGVHYLREVQPGEVLEISETGAMKSYFPFRVVREAPCIFEYVYFARPDSHVFGRDVYAVRKNMGRELACEHPAEADVVLAVPDSGLPAALGYAQEIGIPFELGLIRNHYVGRTFIEPKQSIRDFGAKIKLNANVSVLKGRRVIVVDDSIVRGTTSRKLVKMLRQAGAVEVHVRISAPPTIDPCFYGIDTPEKEQLIAAHKSPLEIGEYLEADSLAYLSLEGLYRAVGSQPGKFCDACFTGRYPVPHSKFVEARQRDLFEEV